MMVSERSERHVSGFGLQVPQLVSPDSSLRQLHDRPHTYPQKGLSNICFYTSISADKFDASYNAS
jgi:hypothetical protein